MPIEAMGPGSGLTKRSGWVVPSDPSDPFRPRVSPLNLIRFTLYLFRVSQDHMSHARLVIGFVYFRTNYSYR